MGGGEGSESTRPRKGGFAAAQPVRRRRQSLYTWFNDHRPALVQPRSKPGPARGGCTGRHGGEENAIPTAGEGRGERTGAARIEDAGQRRDGDGGSG